MHHCPTRTRRVQRALTWATIATAVALGSHLAGGGQMPGWLGVAVPWVASVWLCLAVAGDRLPLARLSAAVGGSQVAFHYLFVLGVPVPGGGGVSAHSTHSVADPAGAAATADVSIAAAQHAAHAGMAMGMGMWMWHAIGAAATIAAMRCGTWILGRLRRTLSGLVAWVRLLLNLPTSGHGAVPACALAPWQESDALRPPGWFPQSFRRRGPPLQLVA